EKAADQAAVDAMRRVLDTITFDGTVVIGEGERDEAPMLYIGERVGMGEGCTKVDIALDPLEGTTITAHGGSNALAVLAIAEAGKFLHAPDTYMEKIAVGPDAAGVIDLAKSTTENLRAISKAKGKPVSELTAIILNRPRHSDLIQEVRSAGARIRLIQDGDVSAAIATADPRTGIDVLFGIGGAPEGVLAAAALRCVGGAIQGRLKPRNEEEVARAKKMGIPNIDRIFMTEEMAAGDVVFCATGVTEGEMLKGVHFTSRAVETESVVMRSRSKTIRYIRAEHQLDRKPVY
ncbi:MAG TPA: class II fructose-bisphosphatase, partial [Bdellovibrionota bacterium]|nr:class II fructose-bisphosphatase [Bdellovibrionota bacterium]